MSNLRTPEARFEGLPDYPFVSNYLEIGGLRMHYVDEGNALAPVVLLLHGEPSWSYLYRHMIPVLTSAGFRAVAPDLIGFGKSDKPARIDDYSYKSHVDWTKTFLQTLDLKGITLFGQDWGALIGLRIATEEEARFDRIVIGNGFLPTGDRKPNLAFRIWKAFALYSPWFPIGRIVDAGCAGKLPGDVIAAYNAPFPAAQYKAGARAFPRLVPMSPSDPAAPANRAAWEVLRHWQKPFLTTFSTGDPIMGGLDRIFHKQVPGCANQPHATLRDAGHFLQEDKGPELAKIIVDFISATG